MQSVFIFLALALCVSSFTIQESPSVQKAGCVISLTDADSPIIISSDQSEFLYPAVGNTSLDLTSGYSIDLVCAGKSVNVGSTSYNNYVTATCVSKSTLKINGANVLWSSISCSSAPTKTARITGSGCENNGKEVEIGFDIGDKFLRFMILCFDPSRQEALYSQATIIASINQRITGISRPNFVQGSEIYDITSVDKYYNIANQKETINALLGLPASSTKYIESTNYFLARGHLTPRSDLFYPAQQNASFFLPNVAPQWQTMNNGNWDAVETYVRDYAENNNVDLVEWTGVYGVTTLPHETTGKDVKLYLYNVNNKKYLPVPEFYWKVVYEPKSKKGVAIVVVNNPYLTTYKEVCDDVSNKVKWLVWDKDNQQKGFGYICAIDSFRKTVNYLPEFTVKNLLL